MIEKARSAASFSAPDVLAVLAGEHQLEQRRVARGEADVCRGGRSQPCLEVLAGAFGGAPELGAKTLEPASARASSSAWRSGKCLRGAPWLTPTCRASSRSDS